MGGLQVVWFKRDLRVEDHLPLLEASRRGVVLPLYIVEPELWLQPDTSLRQWRFMRQSLEELHGALAERAGTPERGLVVRTGDAVSVLDALHAQYGIDHLWAHQETGNGWTFARDRAVRRWARAKGIPFTEIAQDGVQRGLKTREGWLERWELFMAEPVAPAPTKLVLASVPSEPLPEKPHPDMPDDYCLYAQPGGRSHGLRLLRSFLRERARRYVREMSSPLTAERACSRLSAHLAYGTLSLREVVQATRHALAHAEQHESERKVRGLRAFESRLRWRSHFIQRLESLPSLEFENMHPALNGMREEVNPEWFQAWAQGRTGYPFVDACMRMLHATGWINFRMRAMLVAFACYALWQPWRAVGLHLARLYVDYEPGIHWSQMQMQSGSTGMSAFRMYNVVKQSMEQDPEGDFIRRWVPELSQVPANWIHEPWRMPRTLQERYGCRIGIDYPFPIVDHEQAMREARQRLFQAYRTPEAKAITQALIAQHSSRSPRPERARRAERFSSQRSLFEEEHPAK